MTQYVSYYNDASRNFTHKDCEEHFYPTVSQSANELEVISALRIFDFGGLLSICALLVIISVALLLFEILYSQLSRKKVIDKNLMIPLSKECQFSYQSKCTDFKNAKTHFNRLLHSLYEDRIEISHAHVLRIPSNNDIDLSILLKFELDNPGGLDNIVQKFDVFTLYLDCISQK